MGNPDPSPKSATAVQTPQKVDDDKFGFFSYLAVNSSSEGKVAWTVFAISILVEVLLILQFVIGAYQSTGLIRIIAMTVVILALISHQVLIFRNFKIETDDDSAVRAKMFILICFAVVSGEIPFILLLLSNFLTELDCGVIRWQFIVEFTFPCNIISFTDDNALMHPKALYFFAMTLVSIALLGWDYSIWKDRVDEYKEVILFFICSDVVSGFFWAGLLYSHVTQSVSTTFLDLALMLMLLYVALIFYRYLLLRRSANAYTSNSKILAH